MTTLRRVFWGGMVASAILLCGCGGEAPVDAGIDGGVLDGAIPLRDLGERCVRTEDCGSGLCLEVGDHAVCTRGCSDAGDCPGGGWDCITPEGLGGRVCGCAATADEEICGNGLDDDCNGRPDDCRLCGGVPVPEDDPANCGACGVRCGVDQECSGGECRCPAGTMACGGSCIDVLADSNNCGSCGNRCGGVALCENGACECSSIAAPDYCDGAGCVDLDRNLMHCGSCGNACGAGMVCNVGECICPMASQEICGGACTDTLSDAANCGECGRACGTDQYCNFGTCACTFGGTVCGGRCIDTSSDVNNCGTCGRVCSGGLLCESGVCGCYGGAGLVCDGECRVPNDATNCGECGVTCRADQICNSGACLCPDFFGQRDCGGACVSIYDPMNCGACGNRCSATEYCNGTECVCNSGTIVCGSECVAWRTDTANCGACGNTCASGATCSGGSCNCPWPTAWACDGACVDIYVDRENCGTCGTSCPSGTECTFGSCRCPNSNEAYCEGLGGCIDVLSNEASCGLCGNVCPSDATCTTGSCGCDTAGESVCGTECVDVETDAAHCGGCGRACVGDQVCNAGACTCELPTGGPDVRLTTAANSSFRVAVASGPDGALVVWVDARSGPLQIWMQRVATDATPLGAAVQLSASAPSRYALYPSVVWTGTEWGVAWDQEGDFGPQLFLARVAVDGSLVAPPGAVSSSLTTGSGNVLLYTAGLGYVNVRHQSRELVVTALGVTGSTPGVPLSAVTSSTRLDEMAAAAAPTGEIGLVWEQSSALYFQLVNADGSITSTRVTLPVPSGTFAEQAAIAHDGTDWVASWHEVQGTTSRVVVGRGSAIASRSIAVSRTDGTANLRRPHVLIRGGEAVVTWQTRTSTASTVWSVAGRRFGVAGTGAPLALDAAPTPYVLTTSVADENHVVVGTASGALVGWADVRWGATEIYDRALTLPPCAP